MLEKGDGSINSYSKGFIPPSIKNNLIKKNDYIVDFSGFIWGIKHLHLNPSNKKEDDTLLFYVTVNNTIYFLKIGQHNDLYRKDILEIIVKDFPDILLDLGIAPMPDMPMPEKPHNYSVEEVKKIWLSGGNVSYTINNKYYTSVNLQSTAKLPVKYKSIANNIDYQIEQHIELFFKEIIKDKSYQDLDVKVIRNEEINKVLLTDEISNSAILLNISYLKNIYFARRIKTMNLEK